MHGCMLLCVCVGNLEGGKEAISLALGWKTIAAPFLLHCLMPAGCVEQVLGDERKPKEENK